jgi:L-histidine Nalpha-methyltransferase
MLEAAYNDPEGVTAEFNRNMLRHLNRILGADFDPGAFDHHAPWLDAEGRIEMRLVSRRDQQVTFRPGLEEEPPFHLDLPRGRFLVTEHSNKYTLQGFRRLTEAAGWRTVETWTDSNEWFAVQFLERDSLKAPSLWFLSFPACVSPSVSQNDTRRSGAPRCWRRT